MKKLLPPRLFLLCILSMLALHAIAPLVIVVPSALSLLGALPVVFGLGMATWGSRRFRAVGTNIKTFDRPDRLVTDGLFRYSRNPMYLGFVVALVGVWLLLGSATPVLPVLLFVLVTDRWYIPFEERAMARTFGGDYASYCRNTRRWV